MPLIHGYLKSCVDMNIMVYHFGRVPFPVPFTYYERNVLSTSFSNMVDDSTGEGRTPQMHCFGYNHIVAVCKNTVNTLL